VVLSIALQHGAHLDELRHAISRNSHGAPLGPIGTLLDALAAGEGA
jgi:hypothetical protein